MFSSEEQMRKGWNLRGKIYFEVDKFMILVYYCKALNHAGVVERQTRCLQAAVRAIAWEFKSLLLHHEKHESALYQRFFCCLIASFYIRICFATSFFNSWFSFSINLASVLPLILIPRDFEHSFRFDTLFCCIF